MSICIFDTKIGSVGIKADETAVTHIYLPGETIPESDTKDKTALIDEAAKQILLYLDGRLKTFTIPLKPAGTAFCMRVWDVLRDIPYGGTLTYKDAAALAGSPRGARAAGLACNRNPIPIIIPCHRIVGSGGSLTGYRGGLPLKEKLLSIESAAREGQ